MGQPIDFCAPWIDADRLCCPDGDPVVPCSDPDADAVTPTYIWSDDELIEAATGILFRATCRLFPGECETVVRPCPPCSCQHRPCRCVGRPYWYVVLQEHHPVIEVSEVKIDGVVLDADSYRLDEHARLVRTDGLRWPWRNYLDLPDTEEGTFSVTYTAGRTPPLELQMACAALACELKRACGGMSCALPSNVTMVNRQGVTLDLGALEAAVGGAASGLAIVDAAVRPYDCRRAKSRVWHPSLDRARGVHPT